MTSLLRYTLAFAAVLLGPAIVCAQSQGDSVQPSAPVDKVQLLATLKSEAPEYDKARACQQLAVCCGAEAVAPLASLLTDEHLSNYARCALESIADPSAGEALCAALDRVQGRLLTGVVNSLGMRREAKAVGTLTKLAQNRDSGVADEALAALGRIATPEAAQTLRQAVGTGSAEARVAAAHGCLACGERLVALGRTGEASAVYDAVRQADVPKHLRAAAAAGAVLAKQPAGAAVLAELLKSDEPALFQAAIRLSRRLAGNEVTQALLAQAANPTATRRAQVIAALGDRNDPAVLPAVVAAAKSDAAEVRLAAIRVLGQVGNASVVPLLFDAAGDADAELAKVAIESLTRLPREGVDTEIVARLEQGSGASRALAMEVAGLRAIGAAAPAVRKAVADPASEARWKAIRTLGRVASLEDLPILTSQLAAAKTDNETAIATEALDAACARVADADACATKLCEGVAQASVPVRCTIIELLGRMGGVVALKAVAADARSETVGLQDAATRVLGDWNSADAAPVLLDLARTLTDNKFRSRALRGYLRIARQMNLPDEQKQAMCDEAMKLAKSKEEKRAVQETRARIGKGPTPKHAAGAKPLFDGRSFDGWEGDTKATFRIQEGAIVAGSLKERVPHNAFLCTTRPYANFIFRVECKILGAGVNAGIQFRSQRVPNHYEVSGYQADMSDGPKGGYWGCLYDESRRKKMLARPEAAVIEKAVKPNDWNLYEIRCDGARIQLFVNGVQTVDYTEQDASISRTGIIGLQIHGGHPSEAWYRNVTIEELP
jgi:HEAT repeat protein